MNEPNQTKAHSSTAAKPPADKDALSRATLRRVFASVVATLALTSTSAHGASTIDGIWEDGWLGGYGDWLPLGLSLIICIAIWLAKRRQKRRSPQAHSLAAFPDQRRGSRRDGKAQAGP